MQNNEDQRSRFKKIIFAYLPLGLATLFFNSLIAIAVLSYVEGTDSWSPSRGWRVFAGMFGGGWGLLITLVVLSAFLTIVVWAVTYHKHSKVLRTLVIIGLMLVVAFFGKPFLMNMEIGKLIAATFFLGIVVVEVLAEEKLVELLKTRKSRTAPRPAQTLQPDLASS